MEMWNYWHVRVELLEITRLLTGHSSSIAVTIYESANYQNHQLILRYCGCAHWNPRWHWSLLLQMWCRAKSRRTDCHIRPFGLVVCWTLPEGKTIIGTNRANLACTVSTRPHIFSEINDTMKRFWEIDILSIQENGVQAMTREEKIALDKTLFSLFHGEHHLACTSFSWMSRVSIFQNFLSVSLISRDVILCSEELMTRW